MTYGAEDANGLSQHERSVAITTDGVARLAPRREQLFDPGQAYVWCLAEGRDGTIYAGTGDDGRLQEMSVNGVGPGRAPTGASGQAGGGR